MGCLSGCDLHGVWTRPGEQLHLVYGEGCRPKNDDTVIWHQLNSPQPLDAVCCLEECLSHVLNEHDSEIGLICLESAANQGLISRTTAMSLIAAAPRRHAKTLALFDPRAESGSETKVRLFLRSLRVRLDAQVLIPSIGRVDLLVGDSLIVECDSDAHHSGPRVDPDRRRDMNAKRLGYDVIRLSYQQIWTTWEETSAYLVDVIRTRRHRRQVRPLAG